MEETEVFGVTNIARARWKLSSGFEDLYFGLRHQVSSVSPANTKEFGEGGQGCSPSLLCYFCVPLHWCLWNYVQSFHFVAQLHTVQSMQE